MVLIIAALYLIYLAYLFGANENLWTGIGLGKGVQTGSVFSTVNLLRAFLFIFPIFYYVYLHGTYGQTFGKMALRIKVINEDGSPLGVRKAFYRWLVEFLFSPIPGFLLLVALLLVATVVEFLLGKVSSVFSPADYLMSAFNWVVGVAVLFLVFLPSTIMFLWAAFDPRKQGLHDKLCKTLVVQTDVPYAEHRKTEETSPPAEEGPRPADAPPPALDTPGNPPI